MNSARVCWIIRRTVFNLCVCLNHSWRYKHNQFQRRDEKPRLEAVFSNFRQLLYSSVFFVNGKKVLLVAFIKYTLSKYYRHCTQNCKFYYFLETKICFVKKIVQYRLRFMYLFCPKISKMILENHSLKSSFIPSHFYDLILT